jgi:hypothetical protein
MRVGLPHLGQSVLLDVSMTFCRSAVFAIFAMMNYSSFQYSAPEFCDGINVSIGGKKPLDAALS